jgi:hypothetical protein
MPGTQKKEKRAAQQDIENNREVFWLKERAFAYSDEEKEQRPVHGCKPRRDIASHEVCHRQHSRRKHRGDYERYKKTCCHAANPREALQCSPGATNLSLVISTPAEVLQFLINGLIGGWELRSGQFPIRGLIRTWAV